MGDTKKRVDDLLQDLHENLDLERFFTPALSNLKDSHNNHPFFIALGSLKLARSNVAVAAVDMKLDLLKAGIEQGIQPDERTMMIVNRIVESGIQLACQATLSDIQNKEDSSNDESE